MGNIAEDILFQLGWTEQSIIKEYIEHVANKGLSAYKEIIQTGKKEGESLYMHVLNGIFVFERLRPLLSISDIEVKVMMATYSTHDINKIERFAHIKSYNKIGIKEHFEEELERVGIPEFFPEYKEYLEDIATLARTHSAHYHSDGELLIKSHDPYKLGKERIEELRHLIRAMDVIDLSQTLEERAKKADSLSHLNAYLSNQTPVKQYEFQYHKVAENRGILTNIIHNRITGYLEERFECLPLLFYPDGVAYLVEKGRQISVTDDDLKTIAQGVSASINKMTRANFATDFISSTMQGIKVDAKFRELGLSFEEIFSEIDNMVAGRTYQKRRDEMMQKAKDRVIKSVEKATKKIKEQSEQEKLLQQAKAISEMSSIMPESDEGMQTGELLRSYYIFLSAHYKKDIPDVWEYLYNLLNIEDEQQKFYDAFDPLYDRPYIVAHNLTMSYDEMKTCIIEAGDKIIHKTNEQSLELFDNEKSPLEQYIRKQVRFSFSPPECTQFLENLKEYVGNNHAQCCYCGSSFRTGKWMAADVPSDIKVQYFSNRLSGGQAEPKRYVCELCNTHFMLHKLNYPGVSPGGVGKQGVKTYYLHLFPYSFHSDIFLKALRTEIKRLNVDVSSLYAKTERAIRDYIANERVNIPFSQAKRNGFPLPKFSEIQGNILVFPVNCMGQNDSERFLFAVENALLMQRYLGCKVMLTDSSISILEKTEFDDVYIDSIPVAFAGLLPTNNLSNVELEQVWHRLKILYQIKGTVYSDGEEMPVLIRALSENELTLFYVCERFILKKLRNAKGSTDKDWLEIHLSKRITTLLDALIERGDNMEQLKQLARIAWEGRLKGETLKKNSLMIPFDMAFDKLQRKSEFIDLETLQAALSEDIFAYLERTAKADFKPGATKREKIKAFVETFFAGLLKEVYHNNVNKLLADEKMLKSAFLFYVREQIPTKKGEE